MYLTNGFEENKTESNSILLSVFIYFEFWRHRRVPIFLTKGSTEATTKQSPNTLLNRKGSMTQKSHIIELFLGEGVWGAA